MTNIYYPDSSLMLLSGVPLLNDYKITKSFTDGYEQKAYFESFVKHQFNNMQIIRLNQGIQLPMIADDLYNCNYIMFNNRVNGKSKWFYAFITNIEFVSVNKCNVYYDIDVMQSWYFDYNFKTCLIDREHVEDDTIGLHTQSEDIVIGDYITTSTSNFLTENLNVYIFCTEQIDGYFNSPSIVGGMPIACYWASLGSLSNFSATIIQLLLMTFANEGKESAVISIFTAPSNMISTIESVRSNIFEGARRTLSGKVKNKKLYTYPFTSLTVHSLIGTQTLKYELFDGVPRFNVFGGFGSNPEILLTPINYDSKANNLEHTLSLGGFPLVAFKGNYYENWLAQNKNKIESNMLNSVITTGIGIGTSLFTGNPIGSILGGLNLLNNINQTNINMNQQKMIPDSLYGSTNAPDIMASLRWSGFYTSCKTLKKENLKIVDDYFTMYGYHTNRLAIPKIKTRPSFNYLKLLNCNIVGNVPFLHLEKIKTIYQNGICFFHVDDVGNYELENGV